MEWRASTAAVVVVCGTLTCAALADDVGYWTGNEGSGTTLNDSSGNGNALTLFNGSTFSADTPQPASGNYSVLFDGTNDYARRTNTASLQPTGAFTLACWVKLNSLNLGDQDIMIANIGAYGASGGYQLFFTNGTNPNVGIMYRDATYTDRSISTSLGSLNWQANTWYHVTGTYDDTGANSELKLFVDGKMVNSGTTTGNIVYNNTPYFHLGTNYDGDGGTGGYERELNGRMDEVYVFNTKRTDSQIRDLAIVTQTWNGGNGFGNDPAKWTIAKSPSYSSICVLPDYGAGSAYTVTVNALGGSEILDMTVNNHAAVKFDGYSLTVDQGGDINVGGKMTVKNTTYTPNSSLALRGTLELDGGTIAGAVNTYDGCLITGAGTISNSLADNRGTIRAEGGQLEISLASATHNHGTLGAATGGTLYISNNPGDHEIWNKDTVALTGGTLKGYDTSIKLLNYAAGNTISGYGRLQNCNVYVGEGTLTASGGQLQIDQILYTADYTSTVNVQSGATLHLPNYAWENRNNLYLSGGSITGQRMTQTGALFVTGTGSIENVTFNFARTHQLENNATLKITGDGYLDNATISMGGATGSLVVDGAGATIHGRGVINPDVTVTNGSLNADSAGNTLRLARTLTVQASKSASATGGAMLQVDDGTVNGGSLFATGTSSTVTCAGAVTNSAGASIYAASGGTVNLNGNVINANLIHASGGTVNISGTIKDGAAGEFRATSATLNVSGAIESGCDNTFSAYGGGIVKFQSNLDTAVFSNAGPLNPLGGTITLNTADTTLTNAAGKTIAGYGQLLESAHNLNNQGTIRAESAGSTLTVQGTVRNGNLMEAANGSTLALPGALTNNGQIQTVGTGVVALGGTTPAGTGTFTANAGGRINVPNGFTNASLAPESLRLAGGTIAIGKSGATMTNAAGKTLRGYGTLLDAGESLTNSGLLDAAGPLAVNGNLTNTGNLTTSHGPGVTVTISGTLNNSGSVSASDGATMSAADILTTGTISLAGATLTARMSLQFAKNGAVNDNDLASMINAYGDVVQACTKPSAFAMDHTTMAIYTPAMVGTQAHYMTWLAEDRGTDLAGLNHNFAIGRLVLGDGLGLKGEDRFRIDPLGGIDQSVIYCYGLHIQDDAFLDLGGRTIYYLRENEVYNGIVGTGFLLEGTYANGRIIEIPEPSTLSLLALGGLAMWRRRI